MLASLQGPIAASVAASWYGVARPCAESGFAGTLSVQFGLGVAAAAVEVDVVAPADALVLVAHVGVVPAAGDVLVAVVPAAGVVAVPVAVAVPVGRGRGRCRRSGSC
jgi:hypothetical protein